MSLYRLLKTSFTTAAAVLLAVFLVSAPVKAAPDVRSRLESETRVFSIEVRDAEVRDVLEALADQAGLNIITGEGVDGKVSLSFKEIGFRDALEMIIKSQGLTYTVQNNVFWVGTEVDRSGDIATRVIPLSYAEPRAVAAQLETVLSEHGRAYADDRTGSVVVRDLPENVSRALEVVSKVDTRIAQVEIEARIVEASTNFTRQLGVQWGGSYTSGGDTITGSHILPESSGDRSFAVNLPATQPTSGIGMVLGSFTNNLLLDLELSAAESNGDLRIISRPRISTLSNQAATIHSGLTFRVKISQSVLSGEGTSAGTVSTSGTLSGLEEIETGINLRVVPKVTHDGHILLNIDTDKSDPDFTNTVDGIPGVSEKSASTNVLIKDGDTVVIGGLYKTISSDQNGRVPGLSKIPLLGYLFRNRLEQVQNEELLVFITPRIVTHSARAGTEVIDR